MVYSVETHSGNCSLRVGELGRVVLEDNGLDGVDPAKWHDAAQEALLAAHSIASARESESPKHEVPADLQRDDRRALRREWVPFREKFGALPFRPGDPRQWASVANDALRSMDALDAKAGAP